MANAMANATARRRKNGHNGADVQSRLSALRADFGALQQDVRGLANDVGTVAGDQVQEAMSGAMETASEAVDRVGEWGSENLDGVREAVRTQPLAACMIAMGAGAIIGALLRR